MQPYVISKGIEREDKRPKPPFLRQKWPKKGHLRAFMRTSKFDNPLNFNNLAQKAAHTPPPLLCSDPCGNLKIRGPRSRHPTDFCAAAGHKLAPKSADPANTADTAVF